MNKRQLELEAYAAVVLALRAQGELTWKKEQLLHDLRQVLKISDERHRMEITRAEEALGQGRTELDTYDSDSASDIDSSESDAGRVR